MNMRDACLEVGRITIDQKVHRDGAERLSGGADHLQFAGARRPAETRRSVKEAPYRVFENTRLRAGGNASRRRRRKSRADQLIGEAEYFAELARTDRLVARNHQLRR
jgi:hypothetical protein